MPIDLHFVELGQKGKQVVILIHGLLGSSSNLRSITKPLVDQFHVFLIDVRNHGNSPWSESMEYSDMAADIAHFCQKNQLTKVALLGHSMGGKIAMQTALDYPDLVSALVIADIAPKTYTHQQEHRKFLATMQDMQSQAINNRQDALNVFMQETGAVLPIAQFVCQNLVSTATEPSNEATTSSNELNDYLYVSPSLRWRNNVIGLEKNLNNILHFSDNLNTHNNAPALFIFGEFSDYVSELDFANISKLFPNAHFNELKGANHWLHAEKPQEFNHQIHLFLTSQLVS